MYLPCTATEVRTDLGCIPTDPGAFFGKFYIAEIALIGTVSFLFILYGTYLIRTAQGDISQFSDGKKYIRYAIAGLVLVFFGILFTKVVAVNI